MANVQILNAETKAGREAIKNVMAASYEADIDAVPPDWALVRVVEGEPVAFILVDPNRAMAFPGGDLRYAFIDDVATRTERRREGHFRALMQATFTRLKDAGISAVLTHGRYPLYRQFEFEVFTHHSGIFITPEQIARHLGWGGSALAETWLTVEDRPAILDDVLLVTDVKAKTWEENKTALQAAATLAHERNKAQILFEYPPAPSYGSRYSIYTALDTPLTTLARLCGAQICVQGADPESSSVPDADWIKVLDVAGFLGEAVACLNPLPPLPTTTVTFHTEAGTATLGSRSQCVHVSRESRPEAINVHWPTSALAQLVTGYQSIETLCVKYDTQLKDEERSLSNSLFPPVWRLSRNESWTYKP